jgi:hypothetical protein
MNASPAELVEQRALDSAMSRARSRAVDELCKDCLDRRCTTGGKCNALVLLTNSYAWEIVASSAELN